MDNETLLGDAANIARNPAAFHPHIATADRLDALRTGRAPILFLARAESRNFTFEGCGLTETQALAALNRAFAIHGDQCGVPFEWHVTEGLPDSVQVRRLAVSIGYRDGEAIS